ncbi:NADH dehydrogenase [ubiquinone] iron-sulfur protein 6, mitochondrial-like [Lytechinus variegatus]|uniref:NADH dehydrogenase [ubiquinone] iron-sulfur protein 6, mitochondrial-like n=1 Tax=Lytechinus variegatus TaxID=7654 RepID=UPI001BB1073F|nr:NADH dehydrogenase [ubiquinone] iron-sulfur protein 6, mitochondrial-like [Lytechinus variegatus]
MAALRALFLRANSSSLARFSAVRQPIVISKRLCCSAEKVTHTGQVYDEGDYRKLRFLDREKEVNEKFAIDLVHEEPPIVINGRSVNCDGGGGPLGHPKVFINLDQPGIHTCPYCGRRYVAAVHYNPTDDHN